VQLGRHAEELTALCFSVMYRRLSVGYEYKQAVAMCCLLYINFNVIFVFVYWWRIRLWSEKSCEQGYCVVSWNVLDDTSNGGMMCDKPKLKEFRQTSYSVSLLQTQISIKL